MDNIIKPDFNPSFSLEKELATDLEEVIFSDKYSDMSNVAIVGILELLKQGIFNG
jgi:Arc/MetJ-type ribon-helix-helix transcriptional regulator